MARIHPSRTRLLQRLSRGALGFAVAVLLLAWPTVALAVKTDIVVLKNGDQITGEVKGLARGKLDFSTDDAGRLAIEWVKINRLTSPHTFEIETASGVKYYGTLGVSDRDSMLVVVGQRADTVAIPSVVGIAPLDASVLQRMSAYLDAGLSVAKANDARTLNLSAMASYRGDTYGSKISFDSYAQGQEATETSTRNSLGLQATRFLSRQWSAVALAGTEQNDELDLVLRASAAGAMSRSMIRSNSSEMLLAGGLAVNHEEFSSATPGVPGETDVNLEALLVAMWDAFRFDSPTLDFSTSLYLYPSLSNAGRVRGEYSLRLKYELFPDFDVGMNFTDTFDSSPPDENAQKNDYVMAFTIGWSYRR